MATYKEALDSSLEYFDTDELAASTFLGKYALKSPTGDILEPNPSFMHKRLAKEFARIENKYPNALDENELYGLMDHFKFIVPQGSPMAGIGNKGQLMSISNCVHGEALVYTKEHGLVKMRDVQAGTHVLTHKGRFRKVLNHWSNGMKETYTVIRSFSGKNVPIRTEQEMSRFCSMTPEHKIYTTDGEWVKVEDLLGKHNKSLAAPRIIPSNSEGTDLSVIPLGLGRTALMDETLAWIFGLYFAEGAVKKQDTNSPAVYFTLNKDEMDLAEKVSKWSEENLGHKAWIQTWENLNFIQINIFDKFFSSFVLDNFGHGFNKKRIPEWVFSLPEKIRLAFLDGFMTGDATNYESMESDYNVFSIANPSLAYELGLLARSVGKKVRFNFQAIGKLIKHRTVTVSMSSQDEKIKFVKSPELVEVFDMEVEEDHSFVAGDVICHNCFVIPSPFDSMSGIKYSTTEEAEIMKRRGGVGVDISTIRPKGMKTANAAGTTDGIEVFMNDYSETCRNTAQNGRRGALMLTISVHHPEIRTFINIKRDLKKVTGANISIRLTNEFMNAVKSKEKVQLRFPVDEKDNPKIQELVDANKLWDEIIQAAHDCAEPGLLFWDHVLDYCPTTSYSKFKSVSTNPCIIGSTLIAVADGRNAVSIEQLATEGKDVPVYSTSLTTGKVEIKWGRNPRKTGDKKEVLKLTLDDGSVLIATPNHKILLKTLEYKELKDLQPGDSIFPFYSFDSNGYRQIAMSGEKMLGGNRRNRRQYRLISEFNGLNVDPKTHAIHHRNFNSYDDSFENLEALMHEEHRNLHRVKMMGKNNPYYKMSNEWKQKFASHPGETNPRYSGISNEEILQHGRKVFAENGKITSRIWQQYAKDNSLPQYLGNDFRFGSFANFANQVSENHKVVSVEFAGYEDVYNITVDDNHNYHVITKSEDKNHITSSGICIKNCGEITLSPYDSCRLLLINTFNFVTDSFTNKAKFDWAKFEKVARISQRLMDDIVDLEIEAVDRILAKIESDPEPEHVKAIEKNLWTKIKESCVEGRRTGLGVTAVGDMLAAMNMTYGSEDSIRFVEHVYRTLCLSSYKESVQLAKERGAFPAFNHELEKDNLFLKRVWEADDSLYQEYLKYGRRNIANLTTAPAGSVSICTQTTSGIEPAFLISYKRRKKINQNDELARVDFIDQLGDKWQEFRVFHEGFKKWAKANNHDLTDLTGDQVDELIKVSPYHKSTANDVNWVAKVKLQAAAQKWIDHSISNTTNIPNETPVEVTKQIYMTGWESGCKGVTIYRDGSRSGVLVMDKKEEEKKESHVIVEHDAPRRPEELECDVYHNTVDGEKWTLFIGLLDNKPYELMGGLSNLINLPKRVKKGKIVKTPNKNGPAIYNFHYDYQNPEDEVIVRDIGNIFENKTNSAFSRVLSLSLRHGTPVQFVVEQMTKGSDKDSDLFSYSKVMSRVLKNYIKDGTKTTQKKCDVCSSTNLAFQQGCVTCLNCGNSKCN